MDNDPDRRGVARRALVLLDLTNLNDDCKDANIDALCDRAQTPHGAVAAVCVWPRFVARARERLEGTSVKVATVANFPNGDDDVQTAVAESKAAAGDGAHEVDLVLPYRRFVDGDQDDALAVVSSVKQALPDDVTLKVILETGEIAVPELIGIASAKCIRAGAEFLKTSTGKVAVNATEAAARIMMEAIRDSGQAVGFKGAGGIRTTADAGIYLDLADEIMGPDWVTPATFRFGASGLLTDLLAAIEGGSADPGEGY